MKEKEDESTLVNRRPEGKKQCTGLIIQGGGLANYSNVMLHRCEIERGREKKKKKTTRSRNIFSRNANSTHQAQPIKSSHETSFPLL